MFNHHLYQFRWLFQLTGKPLMEQTDVFLRSNRILEQYPRVEHVKPERELTQSLACINKEHLRKRRREERRARREDGEARWDMFLIELGRSKLSDNITSIQEVGQDM